MRNLSSRWASGRRRTGFGLLTEIVALENPYTDPVGDGLDVQVLLGGAPRAHAQVKVFAKSAAGAVGMSTHVMDAEGIATIDVAPGQSYLVNAVVMREADPEMPGPGAMWESLWASLTFEVPQEPWGRPFRRGRRRTGRSGSSHRSAPRRMSHS